MKSLLLRDGTKIGGDQPPYIIAEVNSSHGGDVGRAREMIRTAKEVGCDCVKFQSWSADTLYSESYYRKNRMAKRLVKKFSVSPEDMKALAEYAGEIGIAFSSTPYSREEVDFLVQECHAPFVKIASMELNHFRFLEYIADYQLPMILSTGMGTMEEIVRAVETIERRGNRQICILHCVSQYPASPEQINLRNMMTIQQRFPEYTVGYSDHTRGYEVASAAAALGAAVIEKHFTLDREAIGMDNQMATEPQEMRDLVQACHNVFCALGSAERIVPPEELAQRDKMRRSVVAARDLQAGSVLAPEDLDAKRPGTGIPADRMDELVGKRLSAPIQKDELLQMQDIQDSSL